MYGYQEALDASVEYFNGDELAAKVFVDKYALRDNEKNLLEKTPDDMHLRIASEIARVERIKYANTKIKALTKEQVYNYLKGFKKIVPQGSPMYGIGNTNQCVTLSNCYVLDSPEDSYGGIHWTDEQITQISKRRGGVGIDISKLRPVGESTKNSSRTTSGIASWMERFSNSTREVGQDGRRGAQMQSISVHHPEVLTFANIKKDRTKVTGANISIRLTDEFLKAVYSDSKYEQRWPVDSKEPKIKNKVSAREVWRQIIENAHDNAEPGLLFWDNVIQNSPADCYPEEGFETISTNPCSELPLSALDSCRLLLLNLFGYVKEPFTAKAYFDYQEFFEDSKIAQRMMDDIIDLEMEAIERIIKKIDSDPESKDIKARELDMWHRIYDNCKNGRRTGLGITALGDTIAALGFKYASERSIQETDQIFKTLKFASYISSAEMAEDLGPFPVWNYEKEAGNKFLKRMYSEKLDFGGLDIKGKDVLEKVKQVGRRNISNLTCAPAGSVSIECQTTSGIEPLFMPSYTRKKKGYPSDSDFRTDEVDQNGDHWMYFKVYHPKLQDWMNVNPDKKFEESPWFGACAEDLNWKQRVKLQAAAQQHIDHAISSTLNLPEDVSVEQVEEIYEMAWECGCKGITVYRKNCRTGVLVEEAKQKQEEETPEQAAEDEKRPRELPCDVYHISVRHNQYFVLVGLKDGKPYEVFAGKNGFLNKNIKTGRIIRKRRKFYRAEFDHDEETELSPITAACSDHEETITRLISGYLRLGVDMHFIVQQLEKVDGEMHCFARSVSRALKKYIPDGTEEKGEACPECGTSPVVRQEGCVTCLSCGWSKCL